MTKYIAYTDENENLCIVIPTGEISFEDVIKKDIPVSDFKIIDSLPNDRSLRGAWVIENNQVKEDLNKSKEIAHLKRRKNRDRLLNPLDLETLIPEKAIEAENKRQTIREDNSKLQTEIDSCKTIKDLKAILVKNNLLIDLS